MMSEGYIFILYLSANEVLVLIIFCVVKLLETCAVKNEVRSIPVNIHSAVKNRASGNLGTRSP